MNISYLSEIQMLVFALVLVRFSAFLVAFPIVEGASMPPMVKILFALTMTMVVYPVVNAKGLNPEILSGSLFVMVIKEAFMGLFIGFLARFFYHILTVCGELVTMAMGLSSDQLFNPQMDRSVTGVENFYLLLGGLFFLALNGHHIFIQGLVESFNAVPLAQNTINLVPLRDLAVVGQDILIMGLKLAAPILGAIFLSNMAMGIIVRAVPQINVLVTSWPINVLLGLAVLFVTIPLYMVIMGENLNWSAENLFSILKKL
jgi:flagellar biosynthetic protein FliR